VHARRVVGVYSALDRLDIGLAQEEDDELERADAVFYRVLVASGAPRRSGERAQRPRVEGVRELGRRLSKRPQGHVRGEEAPARGSRRCEGGRELRSLECKRTVGVPGLGPGHRCEGPLDGQRIVEPEDVCWFHADHRARLAAVHPVCGRELVELDSQPAIFG
jgi:hypothetical protein